MAKTTVNSPAPFNTEAAAHEIGCSVTTLRKYIREGDVDPQRTPSGNFIFFEREIAQARELFERSTRRR